MFTFLSTQNKRDYSHYGPNDDSKRESDYGYYGPQVERRSCSQSPFVLLPEEGTQENHDATPGLSDPTSRTENSNAPASSDPTTWPENGNAPASSTNTTQPDNGDTTPKQDNNDTSSGTTIRHEDENTPVVVVVDENVFSVTLTNVNAFPKWNQTFEVTELKETDTVSLFIEKAKKFEDQFHPSMNLKIFPSNKNVTPDVYLNTGAWPHRVEVKNEEEFFLELKGKKDHTLKQVGIGPNNNNFRYHLQFQWGMPGDEHHNFPYKTFDEWIVK
jgi:hypothetical protein